LPYLYNSFAMKKLESYQRAWLRKQAHSLPPMVHIGLQGAGEALEKALAEALVCHELVKVRFVHNKQERELISLELAKHQNCHLVAVTGNTALFYKEASKASDRKYKLPQRVLGA